MLKKRVKNKKKQSAAIKSAQIKKIIRNQVKKNEETIQTEIWNKIRKALPEEYVIPDPSFSKMLSLIKLEEITRDDLTKMEYVFAKKIFRDLENSHYPG